MEQPAETTDRIYEESRKEAERQFMEAFSLWLEIVLDRPKPSCPHCVPASEQIPAPDPLADHSIERLVRFSKNYIEDERNAFLGLLYRREVAPSQMMSELENHIEVLLKETHHRKWIPAINIVVRSIEMNHNKEGCVLLGQTSELGLESRVINAEDVWQQVEKVARRIDPVWFESSQVVLGCLGPTVFQPAKPADTQLMVGHEPTMGASADNVKLGTEAAIEAELAQQQSSPGEGVQESRRANDIAAFFIKSRPDVNKRRTIVFQNMNKTTAEMCRLFDFGDIPGLWDDEMSWAEGYKEPYKATIDSLVSKHRGEYRKKFS